MNRRCCKQQKLLQIASLGSTSHRVRRIEVPEHERPVPRGRWKEMPRSLLVPRPKRLAQRHALFGVLGEHLEQQSHRLIPDGDPETFGVCCGVIEPMAL